MLEIVSFTLGPAQTNAYLVADPETKEAVVIDPSWDGHIILKAAEDRGWRIGHLWYTHAHFDHIGGAAAIADALNPLPHVALHPEDHVLWRAGGGGAAFGLDIDPGPEPTIDFVHGMKLKLGSNEFEVRFTPGHTRGHCVLYVEKEAICFCGDLIFNGSVGRTDLPGGDWDALENSIRTQIFTMPDETKLLSGHGMRTTVGYEKAHNPFVGSN
jgi:glyoxylase-like metal-dependent hydrolase (beta-lactamase superfamily II)